MNLSLRLGPLDLTIIAIYCAVTLGLGLWFGRRRVRSSEDLFLANREASWPLVGASLFSANISSQQFVGQAGLAYTIGLAAGAFQLVGAMCFAFLALFFIDVYLGLRLQTAPEFFERRYNLPARLFVSSLNVVMILGANIITSLYAGGLVLKNLAGPDSPATLPAAVAVIAVAVGTFTIFGGLRAILWVDLLQASVLVAGGLTLLLVGVHRAGGLASLWHDGRLPGRAWSVIQPWDHAYGWLPLLTGAVILGVHGHCTDHDYVQRALAARSVFHAKMGALFASGLKIVALFIIAAPGVIAARLLPGLTNPDEVYPRMITELLPVGLTGLVLAGLLAAIVGSVSSGLSAVSSLVSFDFVLRFAPGLPARRQVWLGRGVMLVVIAGGALLAPGMQRFQGLFGYLVRLWSLLAPPVFVCVVFGIFSRRATSRGAIATLVTGSLLGATAFILLGQPEMLARWPRYLRSPLNLGFLITLVCAGTMLAGFGPPRPAGPPALERSQWATDPMSGRERRIFRCTVVALALLLVAVTVFFSPWGIARFAP